MSAIASIIVVSLLSPASGSYEQIQVGIDAKAGTISGVFRDATGDRFSCVFFISGKKDGEHYVVSTWYPGDEQSERIAGTIRFPDDKTLHLKLDGDAEHGGCGNVFAFDREKGDAFELSAPAKWIAVRAVKAKRAYFYIKPADLPQTRKRAYVVRGDDVRVTKRKTGWVWAEYHGGKKVTAGWIREEDLE